MGEDPVPVGKGDSGFSRAWIVDGQPLEPTYEWEKL